jgi:hypothetical protein
MVKPMAAFVSGVVAGLAVTWGYVLCLRDTIRVSMSYIHDRLDDQALVPEDSRLCKGGSARDQRNAFSGTARPQRRREQRA